MKSKLKEWGLLLLVSTLIMSWTTIPNWRGHSLENENYAFVGTFFDASDYSVHLTMMRAGMEGDWAYRFRFTTEPHEPQFIRLFYVVLGQVNRILRLEPEALFHAVRWLFGYGALLALYRMLQRIFKTKRSQWIAFFLAVMGSGFGVLQMLFSPARGVISPVDLWLIDAYMIFSLALFPHFAFTLALICAAITGWLDFLRTGRLLHVWIVIVSALLVQCVNPIAFILADTFMAAVTGLRWLNRSRLDWREARWLALVGAAQIPLLLYNFLLLNNDPIWSQFTAQNETLSPAPDYYLWGFGLFWILGIIGLIRAIKERKERGPIYIASGLWIAAAFLFAYFPWAIQRRFLLGVTIPFSLLSTYALEWLAEWSSRRQGRRPEYYSAAEVTLIAFMSLTSLVLYPGYALYLQNHPEPFFYPRALDEAFTWIRQQSGPDDFFLGTENTGRILAQKTGRPVYLGHPMETLFYVEKVEQVDNYYTNMLPADWISGLPIRWVVYGPYEKEIAPEFHPEDDLIPEFENEAVTIFRVK